MNKVLISMLVLSVVKGMIATPISATEAGIWYLPNENTGSDNALLTASAVTVFEIQADTAPTYILCLENAEQPSYKMTDGVKYATIGSLMPEPATIALLGFSGFLMRRRKTTQ